MTIPNFLVGDKEVHSDFPFTLKIHNLYQNVLPHSHNFIEYTYVISGYGVETINAVSHPMQPGTLTLLFPHQVHEILIKPGQRLSLYVGAIGFKALFGTDETTMALNQIILGNENEQDSFYQLPDSIQEVLYPLLGQIYQEAQGNLPWNQVMFKARLLEFMVLLDRYRLDMNDNKSKRSQASAGSKIRDIIQYVYLNSKEDITLEALSERFMLSVPYISSAFCKYIGENFHHFLERIRIAHICSLLVTSDLSVTEIGFEAGFKSYPTFSRVFQAHMKMSPSAYRKKQLGNLPPRR